MDIAGSVAYNYAEKGRLGGLVAEIIQAAIEQYITDLVPMRDSALAEVEDAAHQNRVPMVGPLEGQALYVLARIGRARKILEVGSATGYSAIWLGRAAQEADGSFLGMELDPKRHAEAEQNLVNAGLTGVARILHGDAFEILPTLTDRYDFVFIDLVRQLGDEAQLRRLYDLCMDRLAVGGVLAVDNVLHGGDVVSPGRDSARAADALNRLIAGDRRLHTTFLPVRDGLAVGLKVADA